LGTPDITSAAPGRFVDLPDGRIFCRFAGGGSGTALLLIHGLLGSSFCWRWNIEAFAGDRLVLAPDLPGMGDSPPAVGALGFTRLAAQMKGTLDAFGVARAIVVGSSWAGAIALQLALDAPERVAGLVLVSPVHPFLRFNLRQKLLMWAPLTIPAAALLRRAPARVHRWALGLLYGDARRIRAEAVEGYRHRLCRPSTGQVVAQCVAAHEAELRAMAARLGEIRAPIVLFWGTRDAAVPIASVRPLVAALRRSRFVAFEGLGHLPFEEDPGRFNAALVEAIGYLERARGIIHEGP
jgi:pimeloyl-ACP methyl ester carboxylesterase